MEIIKDKTIQEENGLNLGDMFKIIIANWYWFVISIIVCVAGAYLYLAKTPPIYTRTATVLIQDERKGGAVSESAAFNDLGIMYGGRNVDNEILVFKAHRLMETVVRRL